MTGAPVTAQGALAPLLDAAARQLAAAGVAGAEREARLLLALATQGEAQRAPVRSLSAESKSVFEALLRRRTAREPYAYLAGRREFWSLDFLVRPGVLIPRPDSETLVATALSLLPDTQRAWRILDLGTGSGALLLAVLSERRRAWGVGVDRSRVALEQAAANARALGLSACVRFLQGSWHDALQGRFDLVLCNPPYVPQADLSILAAELAYEPRLALDGGPDGLDAYRALLLGLAPKLEPRGALLLELGHGQAAGVGALARDAGFAVSDLVPDLAGLDRCLVLRRCPKKTVGLGAGSG